MPLSVAVNAKPVTYALPGRDRGLQARPQSRRPSRAIARACHSADYIRTQPQGPKFKKDFWQAEVTKMIKVYGAPIDEADVGKIVDYLTQVY